MFGIDIFSSFLWNHAYYADMFASMDNRGQFALAIIAAGIPLRYLTQTSKIVLVDMVKYLFAGLLVFGLGQLMIKDTILGSGLVMFAINVALLFTVSIYFIVALVAMGSWISEKFKLFKETMLSEVFLNLWIGLAVFMLINHFLAVSQLLYGRIIWVIFIAWAGIIWLQRTSLKAYETLIVEHLSHFRWSQVIQSPKLMVFCIMIALSLAYYFYGFHLAFIPYPTAWDANHAYMYIPKIWAENHGILWANGAQSPSLWMSFISFWFTLIEPIKSWFWLSPDTFGVNMNFLSGILVLLFGLGLVKEVLTYISYKVGGLKEDIIDTLFLIGWFLVLLWLTSGMGAFLVFVDNKTDLGVLALTVLALLSGFTVLNQEQQHHSNNQNLNTDLIKYLGVSGFLFSMAAMAKPTAFQDIALFGLFAGGMWLGWLVFLGGLIIVLGVLTQAQVLGMAAFFEKVLAKYFLITGGVLTIAGLLQFYFKKQMKYLTYLVIWGMAIVISLLVFKGPHLTINAIINQDHSVGNFVKSILLGTNTTNKIALQRPKNLLAGTVTMDQLSQVQKADQSILTPEQCSLETVGMTKEQILTGFRVVETSALGEDVGRYVGYGQKEFSNPWWWILFPTANTCYTPWITLWSSTTHSARVLCDNRKLVNAFDIEGLKKLLPQLNTSSAWYDLLSGVLNYVQINSVTTTWNVSLVFKDEIKKLNDFINEYMITTTSDSVLVPYRYLIPFNVSLNWSLQNLSSYYTDIGIIWLILLLITVIGWFYTLTQKHRKAFGLNSTALAGWWIFWLIGGAILWYAIGIIIWTILAVLSFLYVLHEDVKSHKQRLWWYQIFVGLIIVWWIIQVMMNFIRIGSQGSSGPFLWYKMSNGLENQIGADLSQKQVTKYNYRRQDVFNLQFPHYNIIIDETKDRKNEDGVLIAGTYLQYFLHNQYNLKGDGMLTWFWQISDAWACKAYLRLKESNLKYLVIDPNIGTVVMGGGNETLFNRFFAKISPVDGSIEDFGTMTMLVKLLQDGYISLFNSNNLGAKYAFGLDEQYLKSKIWNLTPDQMIITRARLAIARFFPNAQELITLIATIFTDRIQNGEAISDIADVYGKKVDVEKIKTLAIKQIGRQIAPDQMIKEVEKLSQDERLIMAQYLGVYNLLKAGNQQQYQEFVNNLLGQSLGGSSQLIIFKLK